MNANWKNATKSHPCPICGKPDWCSYSIDGCMAVCRRVESPRPAKSGIGWIHILRKDGDNRRDFIPQPPIRRQRSLNAEAVMSGFRDEFASPDIFDSLLEIADDLHFVAADIDRLEVGRSSVYNAWCFPMRDGMGKVIGIRLREYHSKRKWAVAGSSDGLFYDPSLEVEERVVNGLRGRELVIVEGATDVIAAYSIGLPAVGRSSCSTGGQHLKELCNRLNANRVTIVADNDKAKAREGTASTPPRIKRAGQDGAFRLASSIGRMHRVIVPPVNDLRDWLAKGLTHDEFWKIADLHPWRMSTTIITPAKG